MFAFLGQPTKIPNINTNINSYLRVYGPSKLSRVMAVILCMYMYMYLYMYAHNVGVSHSMIISYCTESHDHVLVLYIISHIITPHACARGKAIVLSVCLFVCLSVCLSSTTTIARFGDLGVIARCKYHYSVGKVGKCTFIGLLGA